MIWAFATTSSMADVDAAELLPVDVMSAAEPAASVAPPTISCRLEMDFPSFPAKTMLTPLPTDDGDDCYAS